MTMPATRSRRVQRWQIDSIAIGLAIAVALGLVELAGQDTIHVWGIVGFEVL